MSPEDKIEKIKMMTPFVEQLLVDLSDLNISFSPTDGELDNVVLKNDIKELKISHQCFYRFSGICAVYKKVKKEYQYVELTDKEYITIYMKSVIEFHFKK